MAELDPLYSAEEMLRAEQGYPGYPETVAELIERAGVQAAAVAEHDCVGASDWTVVCGGGSNGRDGRVAARMLRAMGKHVRVVEAKSDDHDLGEPEVIIDAMFGTGFRGSPRPEAAELIERINASEARVFSIDVPSGVDASTGEVPGAAVRADATVTFHGPKIGLVVAPGRFHAGSVHVADIGLEPLETDIRLATVELLRSVPHRHEGDNKYTAGHVLVVGGSRGLSGAPSLTALAAMRADAGYVTVAAPESLLPTLEERLVEAVKRPLPDDDGAVSPAAVEVVLELAERASAVAIGPGLGRGPAARALVERVLGTLEIPVVADADALYGLEPAAWGGPRVLTPHEGELARLLGRDSRDVAAHRLAAVREAAARFDCVVLLKGADTLVAAPDGGVVVSALGLPSLATAGTGDVLTGIVGAFLAKGIPAHRAAVAGAAAQQRASVEAPQRAGLVAGDLVDALPRVLA